MTTAVKTVFDNALRAAIPKGALTISEWAEQYRHVSPQRSARPGRWSNEVVPFARGIMDAVTEPDVRKIVLMKSSQVAGTEIIINILCYYIHMDPSLMLYIAEIEDKARAWTDEAFDPTIAESPELRRCFFSGISDRSSDNNQRVKRFKGGQLTIGWASSPAQLSSRPARIVCFDEVDAFGVTAEGDAVKLAEARTKTFGDARKLILVSSPRDKEGSIIEREYLQGDQRQYYVPCPHCDEFQVLKWANVKWDDGLPENAYYICDECGAVIDQDEKPDMLAKGRWIAENPASLNTASFRINELYSPFTNWGDMAADFLASKKHRDTLKVFINTRLGETWEEEGESIDYGDITPNREEYFAPVPDGVLVLTAGVDVQKDRLECEIVGWGRDNESWSIDYRIIEGSPELPEVWDDLSDHLSQIFEGVRGTFRVSAAAIDAGDGNSTDAVLRFCQANKGRRWLPVKGSSVAGKPLISKANVVSRHANIRLYMVGTDTAKDEIHAYLRVTEPGPGYCHFPDSPMYDEAYFRQLCAEKKVKKWTQGRSKDVWVKVSANARNEALDVRVYATAARAFLKPNYEGIARRRLNHDPVEGTARRQVSAGAAADDLQDAIEQPAPVKRPSRVRVKNNRFSGYKP